MELISENGNLPIDGAKIGLHSVDHHGRLDLRDHEDEMTYFDRLYDRDRFRNVTPILAQALTAHVSTQNVVTIYPTHSNTNISYLYKNANDNPWTTYRFDPNGEIGRKSKRHSRMRNKLAKASRKRNRK